MRVSVLLVIIGHRADPARERIPELGSPPRNPEAAFDILEAVVSDGRVTVVIVVNAVQGETICHEIDILPIRGAVDIVELRRRVIGDIREIGWCRKRPEHMAQLLPADDAPFAVEVFGAVDAVQPAARIAPPHTVHDVVQFPVPIRIAGQARRPPGRLADEHHAVQHQALDPAHHVEVDLFEAGQHQHPVRHAVGSTRRPSSTERRFRITSFEHLSQS